MLEDSTIKGTTQIVIPSIAFQRDDVQLAATFDSMSRPRAIILELAKLTTDQRTICSKTPTCAISSGTPFPRRSKTAVTFALRRKGWSG